MPSQAMDVDVALFPDRYACKLSMLANNVGHRQRTD